MGTFNQWTHGIWYGLFFGLFISTYNVGQRPFAGLRKTIFKTLLSSVLLWFAVGLWESFGSRAFHSPIVFVTIPSGICGLLVGWPGVRKAPGKAHERRRVLARWLVCSALLIWCAFFCATYYYQRSRSTVPDELSGRIYSLNEHGHIVYLTLVEQWGLFALVLAAVVCFISGYVIERKGRRLLDDPNLNNP